MFKLPKSRTFRINLAPFNDEIMLVHSVCFCARLAVSSGVDYARIFGCLAGVIWDLQKQIGEDFVMKPVVRSEIAATIRNILDMKERSTIC